MDQPRPDVERVQSGRRTPVVVGLIAALVVGVLVWKPWDRPPAPLPGVAAPATGTTAAPAIEPTPGPSVGSSTPTPAATPRPLPTPDVAPLGPIGDFVLVPDQGGAVARCIYGRPIAGVRHLESISVQPPVVTVGQADPDSTRDIKRIRVWIQVERNRLDKIFEDPWMTVAVSRRQTVDGYASQPADLIPLLQSVNGSTSPANSIFRVLVRVEWYTRNLELAGADEAMVGSYASTRRSGDVAFEGCRSERRVG